MGARGFIYHSMTSLAHKPQARNCTSNSPGPISGMGNSTMRTSSLLWYSTADRKSTRLNSSHQIISYAVFCLKKKKKVILHTRARTATPHGALLLLTASEIALVVSRMRRAGEVIRRNVNGGQQLSEHAPPIST